MTHVSVTKCPPDPRLFYNRRWGKTSCSKKGNRNFNLDYPSSVTSSFPSEYEKEEMNVDMKPMALYSHGSKGLFTQPTETEECINILTNFLETL